MPFADSFRDLIADRKQRETAEEIYRNPSVLTQKSLNRSALFLNTQTNGLPHTSPGQRPRWACGLKPAGQTRAKALATLFVAPRHNRAWIGARTVWHRFQPVFARRALARRNEAVGLIFALAYHDEILGQHPSQSYLKFRRSSNRRRTLCDEPRSGGKKVALGGARYERNPGVAEPLRADRSALCTNASFHVRSERPHTLRASAAWFLWPAAPLDALCVIPPCGTTHLSDANPGLGRRPTAKAIRMSPLTRLVPISPRVSTKGISNV